MKNYFLEYNNRNELNKFFEDYHMLFKDLLLAKFI